MHSLWRIATPYSLSFNRGSLLIAVLLTGTMLSPLLFWLFNGWASKQSEIFASLSTTAKDKYLRAFQRGETDLPTADKRFEKFYGSWYGKRHYIMPMTLIVPITFYLSVSLADTALYHFYKEQFGDVRPVGYYRLPVVAAASFAGAYTFVVWDFIFRATRRDMTSHDVSNGVLRLAVCIPIGYALSGMASTALGAVVAFAVGAFPLNSINSIMRRFASKQLGLDNVTDSNLDRTTRLSGVDTDIAERLLEADISTISQLAYCDPIQVTMRTNLGFDFVIDIVSQALAWIYLEDKLNVIRCYGLRGAFEIRILQGELGSQNKDVSERARATVDAVNKTDGLQSDAVLNAFHEIADDPRTEFLTEVYNRGG